MNGLNYLLQTNLYLLLFMGFYVLVLKNETFFKQNRLFLNTSVLLSFLIPFINSNWFRDLIVTQKVREAAIMPSQMLYETAIVSDAGASSLSIADAIFWIYGAGLVFLLIRLLVRFAFLRSNLRVEKGKAFSFFNTLVVDKDMPGVDFIIHHERVHMRQWHSADIIFIELAAIVNWFNPVMYLYKKEIRHIHEFIADEEAATLMQSKSDYAALLFSNILGVDPLHLSNNFFNKSLLKRRILMLHKNRSRSNGLWKYGFSAPLFMLMLIVSAATASSESNALSIDADRSLRPIENIGSLTFPGMINKTGAGYVNEHNRALESNKLKPADQNDLQKQIAASTKYPAAAIEDEEASPAQDKLPEFPGGIKAWGEYLIKTLKYPAEAKKNNVQGRVIVSFTVDKDGSIQDVKVLRGIGSGADEEAIRVVAQSPKWIPGTINGEPARVSYTMPINFGLGSGQSPNTAKSGTTTDIKDFSTVEVLPEFAGGMAGWGKYMQANLKYPEEAKKARVTGRVIMQFVVEKDGSLSEIKVLRGIGSGADEEATRVLANSPRWKPGIQEGRPVRVMYTMPVFFNLAPEPDKN
ncbi:M56 family metallopeptidase [Daejeonella sp. JGW-45]|uniref:M56 family metallopeptidase n=1 Tax=Daejeonella sp. JGW-45 TaxID=3034148 RepID=UPI0023EAA0BB|nr:M56 family metallopeptidase [Daejeonella sp. JGW-45]